MKILIIATALHDRINALLRHEKCVPVLFILSDGADLRNGCFCLGKQRPVNKNIVEPVIVQISKGRVGTL